jgi:SAM-dependent methyltransferase
MTVAPGFEAHHTTHVVHWDSVARKMDHWSGWGGAYHQRLTQVYRFLVPEGCRVLEVGCGRGDLLAALKPADGVGVDFSPAMLERARQRHPGLHYVLADAHDLAAVEGSFDFILLSDLVNDLWDIQAVLAQLARLSQPRTRLIINSHSRLWELPLSLAQRLDLAKPRLGQNWLTPVDIAGLLQLSGFEVVRHWPEILWPLPLPLLSGLCNRYLARLWPFRFLAMTNFILARPRPAAAARAPAPRVSVIVPARNEAGNIAQILARTPEMGAGTELIFVEGHSRDDTRAVIERELAAHPERRCRLLRQTGTGKGDAVRLGFSHASGDVLMILDADLTVQPEDLPRFYEALVSGQGEFVNGVRLVYPMQDRAMRFWNLVGNKFFSLAFSWLLGQPIKDTLCGTKALWKRDYEQIAASRTYFGDFDPFGDFDLIFGAARLGLKMVDLPVRYGARSYGATNIQRWKHGWLLLRMVVFAARRLKFV